MFNNVKKPELDRAISLLEHRLTQAMNSKLGNKVDREKFDRLMRATYSLAKKSGFGWHPELKDWAKLSDIPEKYKTPQGADIEVVIEGQGPVPQEVQEIMKAISSIFSGAPVKVEAPKKARKNGKKAK